MKLEIDYARPNLEGLGKDVISVRSQIDAAYMLFKWQSATKLEVLRATFVTVDGDRLSAYPEREV